jgi:hypothetical protein
MQSRSRRIPGRGCALTLIWPSLAHHTHAKASAVRCQDAPLQSGGGGGCPLWGRVVTANRHDSEDPILVKRSEGLQAFGLGAPPDLSVWRFHFAYINFRMTQKVIFFGECFRVKLSQIAPRKSIEVFHLAALIRCTIRPSCFGVGVPRQRINVSIRPHSCPSS